MKFLPLPTLRTALAALCLAAAAPSARADSTVVDGVEWWYALGEDGNAVITFAGDCPDDLVIPAELDGHTVTAIGPSALYGKPILTATLPDCVTNIGNGAFDSQSQLTAVHFGSGLKGIGINAFRNCYALPSVFFGSALENLALDAFDNCWSLTAFEVDAENATFESSDGVLFNKGLKNLLRFPCGKGGAYEIPDGVVNVQDEAFEHCGSVNSVSIPDSVVHIGGYAFFSCTNLASVVFGNGLRAIDQKAFSGCSALASAEFGSELRDIGASAFEKCASLAKVSFSEGLAVIGENAFSQCGKLVSVSLPDSVREIGSGAFQACSALSTVHLGRNLSRIGNYPFAHCGSLERFDLDAENPNYAAVDGVLFSKDLKTLALYPSGRRGTCEVPAGTETIGDCAFDGCPGLTEAILPASVTSIGSYAFASNPNLMVLEVPASWEGTDILDDASVPATCTVVYGSLAWEWEEGRDGNATITGGPSGAEGLTGLPIPASVEGRKVTAVGMMAFQGRTELVKASVPDTVTNVQPMAFAGCDALEWVLLGAGVRLIDDSAFQDCSSLTNVVLPEGLASIGANAFSGCSGLEQATLPESLRTIGDAAFRQCTSLGSVDIPSGVGKIGSGAFAGCNQLKQVALHEGLLVIGDSAFAGCDGNLETLRIPDSVMLVGGSAFYNTALLTLSVPGAWRGGSQLANAEVPEECIVLYRGLAPDDPRYAAWTAGYGLAPDDLPAEEDPDGDGISNWDEFIAGTSPVDGSKYLYIRLDVSEGLMQINPMPPLAPAGRTYIFQGTAGLTSGESGWTDLSDADLSNLAATPYRSFRVKASYPLAEE